MNESESTEGETSHSNSKTLESDTSSGSEALTDSTTASNSDDKVVVIDDDDDDDDDEAWEKEKENCSFCKFFIDSPCKKQFKRWSKCVDRCKEQ